MKENCSKGFNLFMDCLYESSDMKILKKILLNALKAYKKRFPKVLSIEFSSACNAKCIMCPQPEMDRKKRTCLWRL